MLLRAATRGSRLSLIQTDLVIKRLREVRPDVEVEVKIVATAGDVDQKTPLYYLGQKGIFEKEINEAVLDGRADFAVHSLKDVPAYGGSKDLRISATLERGPVADVLVSGNQQELGELRAGSTVGTSSLLRMSLLKRLRPDLMPVPIRGNVENRIAKVDRHEYDAVVLAEAGVERLGLADRINERLPIAKFIPAAGQGIIAAIAREDDTRVIKVLKAIDDIATSREGETERKVVRVLEGGCKVPIGALARVDGTRGTLNLDAAVLSVDGKECLTTRKSGSVDEADDLAAEAADDLLAQGAARLETGWRKSMPIDNPVVE